MNAKYSKKVILLILGTTICVAGCFREQPQKIQIVPEPTVSFGNVTDGTGGDSGIAISESFLSHGERKVVSE